MRTTIHWENLRITANVATAHNVPLLSGAVDTPLHGIAAHTAGTTNEPTWHSIPAGHH